MSVKSIKVLDQVLKGTGLSSRTKSLRSYYSMGEKSRPIAKALKFIRKSNIPEYHHLAVALSFVNRKFNGAENYPGVTFDELYGFTSEYSVTTSSFCWALENAEFCYSRMREDTLRRWSEAAAIIDKLREG